MSLIAIELSEMLARTREFARLCNLQKKDMKNRNLSHSDNWATPKSLYDELNQEFNFDFDPCPLNGKDGLLIEWGLRNFINPPYSRKLKEAFINKAYEEAKKGKLCVMLLPVSTSTKIFHEVLKPNATEIRFIKGRIKFVGTNTKGELVDNKAPMHDSMIVVFDGRILRRIEHYLDQFTVSIPLRPPIRDIIKQIIELTAHEYKGRVWGHDTDIATMDELIDQAIEIIKSEK